MLAFTLSTVALISGTGYQTPHGNSVEHVDLIELNHLYDEEGQLLTGTLADYMVPSADCFPNIRATVVELKPSPHNPLGAKGGGEGEIIPMGGVIANAVAAALADSDIEPFDLPLSPPRLWALIGAAQSHR